MRIWLLSIAYLLVLLTLLYWGYPFNGMIINESWGLHFNEVRQFKFFGYGDAGEAAAGSKPFLFDPETQRVDWSFLHSRRGLVPIIYWLLDYLAFGDRVVFINGMGLLILGANLLLFSLVIWKLADPALVFPATVLYSLYPFAAGIHFWQVILVNNLAGTFLLLSLGLFLTIDLSSSRLSQAMIIRALASLACFWLSLFNHEYALFLSPVFLYIALYESHGRTTLWRFSQWRTPSVAIGLAYVAASMIAFLFLVRDVPSLLVYSVRFQELATMLHLAPWVVPGMTAVINAALFYASALFTNTVGLLLFPFMMGWENRTILQDVPWLLPGLLGLSGLVVGGVLFSVRAGKDSSEGKDDVRNRRFLLIVGVAWAVLSYLPFAMSFGYPRTVGLMADRVNILAACGVAIVVGTLLHMAALSLRHATRVSRAMFYASVSVLTGMLFLNLYLQREHFVEAYRKEQDVARIVLAAGDEVRRKGKSPIILIDRATKVVYPRTEMKAALEEPEITRRAEKIMGFLFERYFRREVLSTSFHLNGIFLFGCCPDSAYQTFDGYAALWAKQTVPVYKQEEPFRLYGENGTWRLGYKDTRVWSHSFESEKLMPYSKDNHQLLILELGEPFFQFRGSVIYNLKPYSALSEGPSRLYRPS